SLIGSSSLASIPADLALCSVCLLLNNASAIGLRHVFPVQTNNIFISNSCLNDSTILTYTSLNSPLYLYPMFFKTNLLPQTKRYQCLQMLHYIHRITVWLSLLITPLPMRSSLQ